jgi:hypothetical protein
MTQAVTVRRDGDSFQARMFWLKAAGLLDPAGPIAKVGFESGPGGFDDIWVEYDPPILDQEGKPLRREHIQCKWHVTPDSYGYMQVADPEFINANAHSLLQRALAAQQGHAPQGEGARFRLVTNWRINREDPLRKLVNERSHTLRVDMLYAGATDRSAMGQIRKFWREHLGVDEAELRFLARTLAFSETGDSLEALRERLDLHFRLAGLRRVPSGESAFIYDDVVFQWTAQGRLEFTRGNFRGQCEKEGLLGDAGEGRPRVYGVKSFEHPTDRLEDRCTKVLNLVPNFADRQIRLDADWHGDLYPALKTFLLDAAMHRRARRQVLRDRAPLTARGQNVHERVYDLANIDRALVATTLARRNQRLDQFPFFVGQIAWIAQTAAIITPAILYRPHPLLPRIRQRPLNHKRLTGFNFSPDRQLDPSPIKANQILRAKFVAILPRGSRNASLRESRIDLPETNPIMRTLVSAVGARRVAYGVA